MEKVTVHNLIILDESGSMYSIRGQALAGLNDTIGTIRSAQQQFENQAHRLSMVTFSTAQGKQDVRYICDDQPVDEVRNIDASSYVPEGGTPLYDAMGTALSRLETQCGKDDHVLVTVITDGMENASHEFSGKAIKSIVGLLKEKGWVFAYIGANQDAVEVASELNISNAMNYEADLEGTEKMFHSLCESSINLYRSMARGHDKKKLQEGFFSEDKS